jgi:riboflavin biosynthesis pyrimidine reductase
LLRARQALQSSARAPDARAAWLLGQLGLSLDGCVATAGGDSYFVTGPASLVHLHRLRALCDAVLVGAGTVAADNPQLTTRLVPGPHPVRVLLDPSAGLDGRARALTDGQAPTLWLCDSRHADKARTRLQPGAAAEVLAIPGWLQPALPGADAQAGTLQPHMARAVAALAARGLRVLLVEGGGVTVSRCLAAGLLDRLHLVFAPVLIGNGRPGLQFSGPGRMADCLRPPARTLALGPDMLWDLDLQPPACTG